MSRWVHQYHVGPVAAIAMVTVFCVLAIGACAPKDVASPPQQAQVEEPAFDPSPTTWDPAALSAAMPGLVGWQSAESGRGGLLALSPDGTSTVIWPSPSGETMTYTALAIDPDGPRVICAASPGDSGTVRALLMLTADGSVEELPMPEGFEGVIGATFAADGRLLVVVYHGTPETFETQLGTYSDVGAWEPIALAGTLPDHQFVERIAAVPDTDAIALVLKTPGGTGARDDEALVLANLDGRTLTSYTAAYRDDALVGATALWGAEGVVYPRSPSIVGLPGVVEIVRAEWKDGSWVETTISEGAALSTGVESGVVIAQDPSGAYWVRTAEDGSDAAMLALFDAEEGVFTPYSFDLKAIDWFVWLQPSS